MDVTLLSIELVPCLKKKKKTYTHILTYWHSYWRQLHVHV